MPEENTEPRLLKPETENPAGEETESYSPMLHGRASDALASMGGRQFERNLANDTYWLIHNGVKVTIASLNDMAGALSASTFLLLCKGMTEFTKSNHTGKGKDQKIRTLEVAIPLKEYAIQCGCDLTEHETQTPEEARKEKKRVQNALKDFRKTVAKDLEVLRHASISWTEKTKGSRDPQDFADIGIVGSKGIKDGYIYMSFTQEWGNYLINLAMTQFPEALYRVDQRNKHAIPMGLKMSEHYFMDSNQLKGVAHCLTVKTLLETSNFQTPEQLAKNRLDWRARVKEPFENTLDVLKQCGVLEDYYYSYPKGVRIPDEEVGKLFDSYQTWTDTLVCFTLKDAPDQTPRLEAREAEYKAKREKKRARKKAAEKKSSPSTEEETDSTDVKEDTDA